MNYSADNVCRFCLCNTFGNEFELVEEITREIVDALLFQMNFDITRGPVICKNCAVSLKRAFNFKSICLEIEDELFPFIMENKKDLKKIYVKLKSTKDENFKFLPEQVVCRLCLSLANKSSVWQYPEQNPELANVLRIYFSQVTLNHFDQPKICSFCVYLLNNFSKLLNTIQNTEMIIEKYVNTYGTNDLGQVDLSAVQAASCNIKQERDKDNNELGFENYEPMVAVEMTKTENCCEESGCQSVGSVKIENNLMREEIHIKDVGDGERMETTKRRRPRGKYKKKPPKPLKIYQCQICDYNSKSNAGLERHLLVHRPRSEIKFYQCDKCDFQTHHEQYLQKHSLQHVDRSERYLFRCQSCPFKTLHKALYKKHILYHGDPSNVMTYKCEQCEFETFYKNSYEKHINSHKDKSEVGLNCFECDFQTIYKQNLVKHIKAWHREPEPKLYECEICDYKAKTQGEMNKHSVTHKPKSEMKMYQCSVCSYEARQIYIVKKHMALIHKSESEIIMYECDKCTFRTKYKAGLKAHRRTHDKSSV